MISECRDDQGTKWLEVSVNFRTTGKVQMQNPSLQ